MFIVPILFIVGYKDQDYTVHSNENEYVLVEHGLDININNVQHLPLDTNFDYIMPRELWFQLKNLIIS